MPTEGETKTGSMSMYRKSFSHAAWKHVEMTIEGISRRASTALSPCLAAYHARQRNLRARPARSKLGHQPLMILIDFVRNMNRLLIRLPIDAVVGGNHD